MSIACYHSLKEAMERLEEINLSPEPKPPGRTSLPAHAASDEDKFSEINQRLNDLESMIINVMQKTGMFNKPGGPT